MKSLQQVSVCWSVPAKPVYNVIHEHISKPLILSNGIVTLDVADLVKFDFEGNFIWRCPNDYGFWGSPVCFNTDLIVGASSDNKIHLIDEVGKIVRTTDLPTSVSTSILVGENGDLWFGIGAAECTVTRIDKSGSIVYTEFVARDQGLQNSLAFGLDGFVWAATNEGLLKLDSNSGKILTSTNDENVSLCCISEPLVCHDGIMVVNYISESSCAITKVKNNGTLVFQEPLPTLLRARLLSSPTGGVWVVGSTVSPWEAPLDSDNIVVARLAEDGKVKNITKLPGQRSIEATVSQNGNLWVGTYTYYDEDDSESGELLVFNDTATLCNKWIPSVPMGVGGVVFNSKGNAIVATSNAIIELNIKSSLSATEPLAV